jgi:hypothetical protein
MRVRLPPKNMNQGIYWVSTYLKYNLDKPPKQRKISKQEHYRSHLYELLNCFEADEEYPEDIINYLNEIHRILQLKAINQKHIDKLHTTIDYLADKYNKKAQ